MTAGLVLSGCDGSRVSSPSGEPVDVRFEASGDLEGLGGEPIRSPITVVTTDEDGFAAPGTSVDLRVVEGGGSVEPASAITDAVGRLTVRWTLGPADAGAHRLEATAGGARATLEATALGEGETDVVVLRGAKGPMKGVVLLEEDAGGRLIVRQQRADADTVIALFPIDGGTGLVAAFPTANAPVLRPAEWTPDIDTVSIELEDPVGLDLRVRIFAGPFEERRRVAREHLEAARTVWNTEGVGVRFGTVEFVDLTGTTGRIDLTSDGLCEGVGTRPTIQVDYVHSIDDDGFWGWGCPPSQAYMGLPSETSPRLLAHELGHVFTLPHTASGLMNTPDPGSTLEEGEIFRAHFDRGSAINAVFGAHPDSVLRDCGIVTQGRCLPLGFAIGEGD